MTNHYPARFKQADLARQEIKLIHVAITAVKMTDDEYRGLLLDRFNAKSSKNLDWKQRKELLDHFKMLGWKFNTASKNKDKPVSVKPECIALMSKIGALLADMRLPWKYAAAIGKRQTLASGGIERLEWLSAEQLHAVVTALSRRQSKVSGSQSPVSGDAAKPKTANCEPKT